MTDIPGTRERFRQRVSLKIAGIYTVIGVLWIFFSDNLAAMLALSPEGVLKLSILKGWFYIIFTALLLYLLVNRDMKELEKAQTAQRLSDERSRTMFELASVGMAQADPYTGHWLRVNKKLCDMTGYSTQELLGKNFSEITHPDDREHDWAGFQQVVDRKKPEYHNEKRYIRKDGSMIWVNVNATVVKDDSGQPCYSLAVIEDISERKQAEAAIIAERNKLNSIMEAMPDGVYIVNSNHNIEYVNPVLLKEFGPVAGRKCFQYFHNRSEVCPWCKNSEVFVGKSVTWEWESTKTGRIYELFDTPLVNADGSISKFEIFYDITEHKRLEESLRRAERVSSLLNKISMIFLTVPDKNMYSEVLEIIRKGMESKFGIFGIIDDNGDLVIPSLTREVWNECQVSDKSIIFPKETWGHSVWGRAIREKKAFHADGPFNIPEGHIAIENFLTTPVVFANQTIALLSVANHLGSYREDHLGLLGQIANFISPILNARLERDRQEKKRKQAEQALQLSEGRLSRAEEIARLGHWDLDLKSQELTWSKEVYRLLEKDPATYMPSFDNFLATIYPEDRDHVIQIRNAGLKTRQGFSVSYRIVLLDGTLRYLQETVEIQRDKKGNATRIFGIVQEITELKRAEESIKEGLRLRQQILDTIPSPIFYKGTDGRYQGVNQAFLEFYGKTTEQVIGKTVYEVFPQEIADKYFQADQDLFQHPGTQVYEFHNFDSLGQRRELTLHKGTFVDHYGNLSGLAGIMIDITAFKKSQGQIILQREELRGLAVRLAEVEEAERQQLARELHDQVCQNLASISIILETIMIRAHRESLDQILTRLSGIGALAEQTNEITREIMEGLRPTVLDHYGLIGGLRQFGDQFSQQTGIEVEVLGKEADPRLRAEIELALFRIAQEALANVNKHARATRVIVNQEIFPDLARFSISDNGVGFDPNQVKQPESGRGWGLMTITERARAIGGHCHIESKVGAGTQVIIEVTR
jgi:PAS domain S-box-containing protein